VDVVPDGVLMEPHEGAHEKWEKVWGELIHVPSSGEGKVEGVVPIIGSEKPSGERGGKHGDP
jgi:hypothetical protein